MEKPTTEPKGFCICPKCGHRETEQTGIPCTVKNCPKCKTPLQKEV